MTTISNAYVPKIHDSLLKAIKIPGLQKCFYCNDEHILMNNIDKKVPYLYVNNNKYRGEIYDVSKEKPLIELTYCNIISKTYPAEYAIYWSEEIKKFDNIIKMLIDNNEYVDNETINFLKLKINCYKWWEEYLILLLDLDIEKSNNYYNIVKNKKYNYNNYLEKVKENKKIVIQVDTTVFDCIKCKNNHRYSRYPVIYECGDNNKKQPILFFNNEDNIFHVKICNPIIEGYINILDSSFSKENPKHIICWTNGLLLLNNIIILFKNNIENINNITIKELAENIYCPMWWDDIFTNIGLGIKNLYKEKFYEYINIIIKYKQIYIDTIKIILAKYANVVENIIQYNYPNYNRIISLFKEEKRRFNEKVIKEKMKEEIIYKIVKNKEEEDRCKEMELEEIRNYKVKSSHNKLFEETFVKKLHKHRKGDIRLLATINPDSNIMADLTMKIGEISILQVGIDSEEKIKKNKVWEYYILQEKEIKEGIKYKKPEYSKTKKIVDIYDIPDIPNIPTDIKKPKTMIILSNTQKQQYSRMYEKFLKEKSSLDTFKDSFVLDDWQTITIDNIRNGNSCLIIGPTSGGKTYVMMAGLNNIINSKEQKNIVYISPSVELARQTYANIKRTFANRKISLITSQFIEIIKESNIFIGTAPELILYFTNNKINFHIGIFDEIHVASKLYFEESNPSEVYRAMAYSRLLVLCKDQVIAASATIKNEEDMCIFIANKMNEDRTEDNIMSYKNIIIIKYHNRVVPLQEYRFINNNIIPLHRDIDGIEINNNTTPGIYHPSPENTFILFLEMKNRKMIPAIFFEDSDDIVWKTYIELIKFLEVNEANDYKDYHKMVEMINNHIIKFNIEFNTKIGDVPEKESSDASRLRFGKTEDIKRSLKILRTKTIKMIINDSKVLLEKSIKYTNELIDTSLSLLLNIDDIQRNIGELYLLSDSYRSIRNIRLKQSHIDMLEIIKKFNNSTSDQIEQIFPLDINKGSYYRFSNTSCGIEQLKAMREPGDDQDNWKQRKKMEALAKAQNIKPKDIDGIIDIIMRGLEFGISIIISSLPFVIQNIILENIRTKNMGVVFSSEDMSMGINYPLRSVNIRSPNNINASKLIQMSGRCGRRGKDTQAHVIYWGVPNAHEAHHSYIRPLVYKRDFILEKESLKIGLMISNHKELALKLGIIHYIKFFKDVKKEIEPIKKTKEPKKTLNFKRFIKFNKPKKEETDVFEKHDKLILEKRTSDVKLFRSQYIDPAIRCLCTQIGLEDIEIDNLSKMICDIDNDIIKESYNIDSFKKSRKINSIIIMMIELYNFYASSVNTDFLDFIEYMINILKICEYRLIKLSK